MNNALVTLIRKYENKADKTKGQSFRVSEFYRRAAESVLALAKQ